MLLFLFMKILLIHQFFLESNGSGGSRWNEFVRIWEEDYNAEVTVLAGTINYNDNKIPSEYKHKLFTKKRQGNSDVYRCYVYEGYNTNFLGRLFGYFSFVFSSLIVGCFFLNKKYDIIIVTSPPLFIGISGYLISLVKRVPYLFEIRDLWPESAVDSGVVKNKFIINLSFKLEKFIYRKAKLINVLTPAFKNILLTKKGIKSDKIIYIPNASDFSISEKFVDSDFTELKSQLGLNGKFVVTYVGAHGLANNLFQILDTALLLAHTNVHFLFIGQGMEKDKLLDYSNKLNLNNVTFLNPVPKNEIFKYICLSDVCTSVLKKCDTFKTVYSNKTFDYMSCKKPILMAIDGASRDLIEEANCGLFVEPENPNDFKDKILIYLNNKELLELHGENGYNFAKINFDRNFLASKYINHLKSLC